MEKTKKALMESLNFSELPKRWYVLELVYGRSAMMMLD
jgi:hypothetical protein